MKQRWLVLGIMMLVACPAYAADAVPVATPSLNIIAVVGSEAITSADLDNRTKFIIATAQLSNTPETIARIRPQVLRSLIDESLQLQEAKKYAIELSDRDLADAVSAIEASRGMEPGDILASLRASGVPEVTFLNQVRAQLAWNRLISKKARPLVRVSDEEVSLAQQLMATRSMAKEVQVSVLTLPIDKPERETDIKRTAEKLVAELRKGANFEEMARQFATSSASKVDAFWIRPEQLDPVLAAAVANLQEGSVTDPQRTQEGFTIVKLLGSRDIAQENTASAPADASQVRDAIFRQKMELEAQKYMRNLRRDGFVDIRL